MEIELIVDEHRVSLKTDFAPVDRADRGELFKTLFAEVVRKMDELLCLAQQKLEGEKK